MAQVTLSNGTHLYWLSFGTGNLRPYHPGKNDEPIDEQLVTNIKNAIRLGFTNIDTAEVYGSERTVGKAIKESGVPRDTLYIVTKILMNITDPEQDIKKSLERLGVSYIDQYLIHNPEFTQLGIPTTLKEAWQKLETLVDKGYTKSIGVSNFDIHYLEEVLSFARIKPIINQIEYHPSLQNDKLIEYSKKHGIATAAYGALAPLKSNDSSVKAAVEEIAKHHGKSPAQVLLRWARHKGIDIVVTFSRDEQRLKEYAGALEFSLTSDEVKRISEDGAKTHVKQYWTNFKK